jgi:hypothetical protein
MRVLAVWSVFAVTPSLAQSTPDAGLSQAPAEKPAFKLTAGLYPTAGGELPATGVST